MEKVNTKIDELVKKKSDNFLHSQNYVANTKIKEDFFV
jgi:hypothetical protein